MGTLLMRSAGCAFNDWADRRFDPHVERTASRPLATGEIGPREALVVAAVLAFCAFLFVLTDQPDDDPAVAAGDRDRVRLSVLQALPLAAAGVARASRSRSASRWPSPPSTTTCRRSRGGCSLINLFWVVAYDTEYAMVDRDDDLKLGLRTSAIAFGRFDVVAVMACYAVYLAGMAWVGVDPRHGARVLRGPGRRRPDRAAGTG